MSNTIKTNAFITNPRMLKTLQKYGKTLYDMENLPSSSGITPRKKVQKKLKKTNSVNKNV